MLAAILSVLSILIMVFLGALFIFMGWPLLFSGAPFMPSYRKTRRKVLEPIFELAQKAPGRKFVDVGSGDGRVVMEFARQGFDAVGIEINPFLAWWSRIKLSRLTLKNAKILRKNFWHFDFSDFDVVFIFQLNRVNALITEKFKKELKPGAIIISAGFPFFDFELITKQGPFWVYKN